MAAVEPRVSADLHAPGRTRAWLPAALTGLGGAVALGLVWLLWFGLIQRERGTVVVAAVPFRQAPPLTLGLFGGGTFRLADELASGKPVLVNFWASWCVPCRDEAPMLEAAWQRERGRVSFVGVDVQDIESDALAFIKQYGLTYPNGAGGAGTISVDWGMRGVPETYFVAPDGRIIRKWNGPLTSAGLDQFIGELRQASSAGASG